MSTGNGKKAKNGKKQRIIIATQRRVYDKFHVLVQCLPRKEDRWLCVIGTENLAQTRQSRTMYRSSTAGIHEIKNDCNCGNKRCRDTL